LSLAVRYAILLLVNLQNHFPKAHNPCARRIKRYAWAGKWQASPGFAVFYAELIFYFPFWAFSPAL